MRNLVSIIIPTYNRGHLLSETLDSIRTQSYPNWECIIVDDGSDDHTAELVEFYVERDARFKYYQRPDTRPKGANACRNYGFEKSTGKYIQWFDSDDLMVMDALKIKVEMLKEPELDYVISKTECFKDPDKNQIISRNEKFYTFNTYSITNYNYVTQRNNWLTYDFMGKRELLEKVNFNEKLSSNQERNFFCKLTCFSQKAVIIDKFLTKVRIHSGSIQGKLRNDDARFVKASQHFFYLTWLDLKNIGTKDSVEFLFFRTLNYSMHRPTSFKKIIRIAHQFLSDGKFREFFWYIAFQIAFLVTGRGHKLRKQVLRAYNK